MTRTLQQLEKNSVSTCGILNWHHSSCHINTEEMEINNAESEE